MSKNNKCKISLIAIITAFCLKSTVAIACAGCIDLDEINFDKTIARFKYALVKFDIAFPYGDKHDAFAKLSKAAHKATDEILIATVGIKDYGELENKELGERFQVNEKNFPEILLFKNGNTSDYQRFPAHHDVTLDNLKQFVSYNTELYIGPDGCIKSFNDLAKNYANQDDQHQTMLITKAGELLTQLKKPDEQNNAKIYITLMRKINEKGYDFVENETKRLMRLRAGKITDAKKIELTQKLNILESFRVSKLTKIKSNSNSNNAKSDL